MQTYGTFTRRLLVGALAFLLAMPAAVMATGEGVDKNLPSYAKVGGISGNMSSVGSDTLNNLMALWSETFRKYYPSVNIQVEGKGSSTAPPALIEGVAQLGPMSRKMKSSEIDKFEAKYGFKPTPIGVALDTLAVFAHRDNPIQGLSLEQVDAMFSTTRKFGMKEITTWGQAGLTGAWSNVPISLYGRNSASGTYGYFKQVALKKGDFKNNVKEQPGSASVVQGVESDRGGLGYSGIGYRTSGVKVVPISKKQGSKPYAPTPENAISGKYPLARMLYVYVALPPKGKLDPATREFLNLVLSREGQEIVVKDGYIALPESIAKKQRALFN